MIRKRIVLFASLACLTFVGWATAQRIKSTLSGVVTDPSGAVIPGAEVVLTNEATNVSTNSLTTGQGTYAFPFLDPGKYSIKVSIAGFKTMIRSGVLLRVATDERADLRLELGQVGQEITVVSDAPLLEKVSSSLGQSIDARKITDLPIGTNVYNLINIMPGSSLGGPAGAGVQTQNPSVNGTRPRGNSFTIDGVSANQEFTGFQGGAGIANTPQLESVGEFKILTSNYSAEYGRVIGALVSLQTKSGSNQLHGSLWEYPSIRRFNAWRSPFSVTDPTKGKFFQNNRFGGAVGGPITKNKLFYFAAIDVFRMNAIGTSISTVPTLKMKSGDFSESGRVVYDPATTKTVGGQTVRDPFPNNSIPSTRFDAAAKALMAFYPDPNRPDFPTTNNYTLDSTRLSQSERIDSRVDYLVSAKDRLSGGFSWLRSHAIGGRNFANGANPNATMFNDTKAPSFQVNETHTFSPRMVSEARVGYQRVRNPIAPDPESAADWRAKLNLPAIQYPSPQIGFPYISLPGFTTLGTPYDKFLFGQDTWNINETLSWNRGKHFLKLGGSYSHLRSIDYIPNFPAGGYYFTSGSFTSLPGRSGTGHAVGDFLLGMPGTAYAGYVPPGGIVPVTHEVGLFVQDDFRVSQKLTLNLGMRWDVASAIKTANHALWVYDPATNANVPGEPPFNTDWNNIGPRVGFAYLWDDKTVLRGGYGISYFTQFKGLQGFAVAPPALQQHAFFTTDPLVAPFSFRSDFGKFLDLGNATTFPLTDSDFTQTFSRDGMAAPYLQSWNLTLERQVTKSFLLSASYVGNKGTHLDGWISLNQLPADKLGPDSKFGGLTPQQRKVYPAVGRLYNFENGGNSLYHALQVKGEWRYSRGLSFLASYTHSKAMDVRYSSIQNSWDRKGSWGPTDTDLAHTFVYSYIYDLPWFRNPRQGLAGHALYWTLGGWELAGIMTVRSGFPFTVTGTDVSGSGGSTGSARPNRIASGELPAGQQSINKWFDASAFVTPDAYTFGNSGINILRGPDLFGWNQSFFKHFKIHEEKVLELRVLFNNFTNTPGYNNPSALTGTGATGRITSVIQGPRTVGLNLKLMF